MGAHGITATQCSACYFVSTACTWWPAFSCLTPRVDSCLQFFLDKTGFVIHKGFGTYWHCRIYPQSERIGTAGNLVNIFPHIWPACRAVRSNFWFRASLLGGMVVKSLLLKTMPLNLASSTVSPYSPNSLFTKACRIGWSGVRFSIFSTGDESARNNWVAAG